MKEKNNKNIVAIIIFVLAIALLIGLIYYNSSNDSTKKNKTKAEVEQIELFTSQLEQNMPDCNGMTDIQCKSEMSKAITNTQTSFDSSSVVGAYALDLTNTVNSFKGTGADLVNTIKNMLNSVDPLEKVSELLYSNEGETPEAKVVTIKSDSACTATKNVDSKYCINNLSAKIYVKDPKITNWAVVVHPFMTNGGLMYNAVGTFYTNAGYNVIAPDLRGFGSSGGSVAMGYLEALDVYDWIRYINQNYEVSNVIVHGVSLGGATTIQLGTNPDIAKGVYGKTLSELHVNGFVDDCGYTSMSGIITGMLTAMDISSLTSMLSGLGIDLDDFMAELQKSLGGLGINGFESFDVKSFGDIEKFVKEIYSLADGMLNPNSTMDPSTIYSKYFGNADVEEIIKNGGFGFLFPGLEKENGYGQDGFTIPNKYIPNNKYTPNNNYMPNNDGSVNDKIEEGKNTINEWQKCVQENGVTSPKCYSLKPTSSTSNSKVKLINNSFSLSNSDNFLDGIIGTLLMKLVGVGLTEENYDYYSDSFAQGRNFPTNSKVLIIHGTADTTVPHSNADTVAEKAGNRVVYQWNASGKPHAFVIIGNERDRYSNLVKEFTTCVGGGSCNITPLD